MNNRIKDLFESNKEVFSNEEIKEIFIKASEYENLLTMIIKQDGSVIKKKLSDKMIYHYQALDECNEITNGYNARPHNVDKFSKIAAMNGNIILRNYNGDYLACDLFLPANLTQSQYEVLKQEEFFLEKNGVNLKIYGKNINYNELIEVYQERGKGFEIKKYYDKNLQFRDPNCIEERIMYFDDDEKSI